MYCYFGSAHREPRLDSRRSAQAAGQVPYNREVSSHDIGRIRCVPTPPCQACGNTGDALDPDPHGLRYSEIVQMNDGCDDAPPIALWQTSDVRRKAPLDGGLCGL